MSILTLNLDEKGSRLWFPGLVTLNMGVTPSSCEIFAMYDGLGLPDPANEIEVIKNNERIFSGKLERTEIVNGGDFPQVKATYANLFALLNSPCEISYRSNVHGEVAEVEGKKLIFNEDYEADKCCVDNLSFSIFLSDNCLWSALDILRYLNAFGLSNEPYAGNLSMNLDEISEVVKDRLESITPLHFVATDHTTSSLLSSLCKMCGVGIAVNYSTKPPEIELFARPYDEFPYIDLDAGSPGSTLNPQEPPDISAFRLTRSESEIPASVYRCGMKRELEATLFLEKNINNELDLEDCTIWNGDLLPDWTGEEQDEYELVYTLDPFEQKATFVGIRKNLSHVYRKYRVNPDFSFRQFFGEEGKAHNLAARESFCISSPISLVRPEVLSYTKENGWDVTRNEYSKTIATRTLEHGLVIEFATPVAVSESSNPNATKVDGIAYSLCLTEEDTELVKVNTADYFPDVTTSDRVIKRTCSNMVRRIVSPHIQRIQYPIYMQRVRDDLHCIHQTCLFEIERYLGQCKGHLVLPKLRDDITPSTSLRNILFEKGLGGKDVPPIEIRERITKVVLDPRKVTTEITLGSYGKQ